MMPVDISSCQTCSLCVLVCPPWQQTRDIALTPKNCIRALQHGAQQDDLHHAAGACILCGACKAACPREIDLYGLMQSLRASVFSKDGEPTPFHSVSLEHETHHTADRLFIPSSALQGNSELLHCVMQLLNQQQTTECVDDIGEDIIQALALGLNIPLERRNHFLKPLKDSKTLIVDNGLLYAFLRQVLPYKTIIGLGEALNPPEQSLALSASDLYVINARVYHADHNKLQKHYDQIRRNSGCKMNLDLQRIAIPTLASVCNEHLDPEIQIQTIQHGYNIKRIIVEDSEDIAEFRQATDVPVLHLAELIENE